MNDHGTIQLILAANRGTILTRLLLAVVVFVVLTIWFVGRDPKLFPFMIAFLAMVALYSLYPLVRMLLSGQAIIVTDEGLVDRTGALEFVRWGEIRSARVRPYMGLKLVELDLNDQEAVLARLPPIRRALLRYSIRRGVVGPYLKASFVQGGVDAVMRVLEEHGAGGPSGQAV